MDVIRFEERVFLYCDLKKRADEGRVSNLDEGNKNIAMTLEEFDANPVVRVV